MEKSETICDLSLKNGPLNKYEKPVINISDRLFISSHIYIQLCFSLARFFYVRPARRDIAHGGQNIFRQADRQMWLGGGGLG